MKRKTKIIVLFTILIIIGAICGVGYYIYSSKTLLVKIDNNIEILSMGMSDDFETAIEYGANMVRVGTALFGKRVY